MLGLDPSIHASGRRWILGSRPRMTVERREGVQAPCMESPLFGVRRQLDHAEGLEVGVEDGFLFHALVLVLLADLDDLAQDLGVEAFSPLSLFVVYEGVSPQEKKYATKEHSVRL
jgi:hypothetical protein